LYFPYSAKADESAKPVIHNGTVSIPKDPSEVNITGSCGKLEQSITLHWISAGVNATEKDTNYLTLNFGTGNESKITEGKFALTSVEYMVTFTNESFPNATEKSGTYKIQHLNKEQVPIHKSYKCLAKRTLKNDNGEPQELKIASSQFEAFRNVTGDKTFSPSEECSLDGVTDIVPIAVGASLAGLVVIVLIAYLIGRRRSRARGYQSV
jgi:lysosomal-associated membrane protein 1/2